MIAVCGTHAADAMLDSGRLRQLFALREGARRRTNDLIQAAQQAGVKTRWVSVDELDKLADGAKHQGVVGFAVPPSVNWRRLLQTPDAPLVVLDGVTDPRNLGAVLRAARAFAAAAVVVPSHGSAPLTAAAAKAASGAAAFVPIYRAANLRRALHDVKGAGWFVVGACEDAALTLSEAVPAPPICWVLGGEGAGMRRLTRDSCDVLARIPTVMGEAGCLNVAAACAVCLACGRQKSYTTEQ